MDERFSGLIPISDGDKITLKCLGGPAPFNGSTVTFPVDKVPQEFGVPFVDTDGVIRIVTYRKGSNADGSRQFFGMPKVDGKHWRDKAFDELEGNEQGE